MVKYENECVGCDVCYHCGAKRVAHYYCDDCGKELDDDYRESGSEILCDDCWYERLGFSDSITIENADIYGQKNTKTVELNGFWADGFSPEEINEILKREWLNGMTEAEILEDVRETAEWDKDAWIHAVNN